MASIFGNIFNTATQAAVNLAKEAKKKTSTPTTPTVAAPTKTTVPITYYTPEGNRYSGYNINGKTYEDEAGTKRISEGSIVNNNDGSWWKLTSNGGVQVGAPSFAKTKEETSAYPNGISKSMLSKQGDINDVISALQTYQNADSMGRDESNARAYSQLNNQYNAGLDKTLSNYNKNAVSRGMFGQLPIEELKQNAISESELNKANAINSLSNSMYTEDYNMARQKDSDYYTKQNSILNALNQGYNIDSGIAATKQNDYLKNIDLTNAEQQKTLDTLGAYSNDYQAKINELTNDNDASNDWQIPYLQSARQDKISNQASAEAKAQQTAYDNAIEIFKATGVATDWIADTLGIKPGTYTADYANILADNALAVKNSNKVSGGSSKGSSSSSKSSATNEEGYDTLTAPQKLAVLKQAQDMLTTDDNPNPSEQDVYKLYFELVKKLRENPNSTIAEQDIKNAIAAMNQAETDSKQSYQTPGGILLRNSILGN